MIIWKTKDILQNHNKNKSMKEFQFSCFQFVLQAVTSLILVLVANYWLLLPTIFMGCLFYGLRHIYVKTARCLKRLESMGNDRMVWILSVSVILIFFIIVTFKTGRSPIFAHTNATISGLTTIRAYKSDEAIIREFNSLQDSNSSVCFLFNASARALAMWLEIVCVLYMTVVVVIFFIFETGNCWKVNFFFYQW